MKKKIIALLFLFAISSTVLIGCQSATKSFGGSMTLELEPGLKLEEITWKDDSLWYLTRPMRKGESAETHTFNQSSEWGIFEGTVTVVEKNKE